MSPNDLPATFHMRDGSHSHTEPPSQTFDSFPEAQLPPIPFDRVVRQYVMGFQFNNEPGSIESSIESVHGLPAQPFVDFYHDDVHSTLGYYQGHRDTPEQHRHLDRSTPPRFSADFDIGSYMSAALPEPSTSTDTQNDNAPDADFFKLLPPAVSSNASYFGREPQPKLCATGQDAGENATLLLPGEGYYSHARELAGYVDPQAWWNGRGPYTPSDSSIATPYAGSSHGFHTPEDTTSPADSSFTGIATPYTGGLPPTDASDPCRDFDFLYYDPEKSDFHHGLGYPAPPSLPTLPDVTQSLWRPSRVYSGGDPAPVAPSLKRKRTRQSEGPACALEAESPLPLPSEPPLPEITPPAAPIPVGHSSTGKGTRGRTQKRRRLNGRFAPSLPISDTDDSSDESAGEGSSYKKPTARESVPGAARRLCEKKARGKRDVYRCKYTSPIGPHYVRCSAVLQGKTRRNWVRHLSTVHGLAESRAIEAKELAAADAIALKDPDCRIQRYECPLDTCQWFAQKRYRWHISGWGRLDRDIMRHGAEWHLEQDRGRISKKKSPPKDMLSTFQVKLTDSKDVGSKPKRS